MRQTDRMSIKQGVSLAETDILSPDQLRTSRLLSLTTVDELYDFVQLFPAEAESLFGDVDLTEVGTRSAQLSTGSSVADMEEVERTLVQVSQGFGALPPVGIAAEVVAALASDTLDHLALDPPEDAPRVNLTGFGPIRNQGERGTCVAHAVCAIYEYTSGQPDTGRDLSEQFLYWLCKVNDGAPNAEGTWIRVAAPLSIQYGICPENVWPYNPGKTAQESQGPPPPNAVKDASARRVTAASAHDPMWVAAICSELDAGRPVAISVPMFPNRILAQNTGDFPMPLPGTVPKGGHAMCVVGYGFDDGFLGGGYLILRNSWGTEWGTNSPFGPGHGTLPFGYVQQFAWEAWTVSGPIR